MHSSMSFESGQLAQNCIVFDMSSFKRHNLIFFHRPAICFFSSFFFCKLQIGAIGYHTDFVVGSRQVKVQ